MGSKMVKCKQTQERKSPIQLKLNETTKQRMDGRPNGDDDGMGIKHNHK